jgi:transcriptional regulator with XRE-family HTH domain
MTQAELAVALGVTPSTVYLWEAGRSELSALRLRQLAQFFGVGMEEIVLPEPPRQGKREAA